MGAGAGADIGAAAQSAADIASGAPHTKRQMLGIFLAVGLGIILGAWLPSAPLQQVAGALAAASGAVGSPCGARGSASPRDVCAATRPSGSTLRCTQDS